MRIPLIAVLFCLAACPVTALAESPDAASVRAPAPVPANAMRLSKLVNPREKVVDVAVRALEFGFNAELERASEEAAIFEQHPGLDNAILEAVRRVVRQHVIAGIPALERRCAEFYAERFSSAEIDGLIEFYNSPTGSKLIQGMYAGADFSKLMEGISDTGEADLTPDDLNGFTRSTVTRILPIFDSRDEAYLDSFGKTALFAKLRRTLPDLQRLIAEIANEPTPEMDAEIEEVIDRVVNDFLAQEEARSST